MSNRQRGVYDSGAVSHGVAEADVALEWVNELREILKSAGHKVVRTRVDAKDPCPVSRRDDIATSYHGDRMLSIHLNDSGTGKASGTEVFYRGPDDKRLATLLSVTVSSILGIPDRGPKTESQSQHTSLAVMEFDKCWLIELGFVDNDTDRAKVLDARLRKKACEAIAKIITSS